MIHTKMFTHDALENTIRLRAERIVCPTCNGSGSHVRRDIDDSMLVETMMDEGDYDGMDSYYRGGFDEVCTHCNGRNVVDEIDWDTFEKVYPREYKLVVDWEQSERDDRAEMEAERRMGA